MRFEFDNYNMIFDFEQNKCSIAGHAKEIDSLLLTSDIVSVEIKYVEGMLVWECTVFCERSCFKWIEFGLIVDKSPKVKEREERLFISCVPVRGFYAAARRRREGLKRAERSLSRDIATVARRACV